jgi:hypothetical protein
VVGDKEGMSHLSRIYMRTFVIRMRRKKEKEREHST